MKCAWSYGVIGFTLGFLLTVGSAVGQGPSNTSKHPVEIVPSVGGATSHPMALTRDGRFAAIATGNGAELWDLEKGRLVRKFTGLKGLASCVDISADGTRIAAAGSSDSILIWDLATGRLTSSINADMGGGEVTGVGFSSDGSRLAYAGNPKTNLGERAKPLAIVREIASGRTVQRYFSPANRGFGSATSLAVSLDRSMAAVGDNDGSIRVFGFEDGKAQTLAGHRACSAKLCAVTSLSFSHDGRYLASGSYDATVKIWDVATSRPLRSLPAQGGTRPRAVSWSVDDGALVVADDAGSLRLWNPHTADSGASRTFRNKWGPETADGAVHMPDGKSLLLDIWGLTLVDAQTLETIRTISAGLSTAIVTTSKAYRDAVDITGGSRSILSVSLDKPDVRRTAYGAKDEEWFHVRQSRGRIVGRASVKAGGDYAIISGDQDRPDFSRIVLNDLKYPEIALSPDGRTGFVFAKNNGAMLFDAENGRIVRQLSTYKEKPGSLLVGNIARADFSPDGRLLVTHDLDSTFQIWDVASGRSLASTKTSSWQRKTHAWAVKFLPDGRTFLATGTSYEQYAIDLRSVDGARLLRRMQLPGANPIANSVDVHPNGNLAIVSGHDGILRLWNLTSGSLVREYQGHAAPVPHLAFAMDGSRIVSGAPDGLKIWDTETGELLLTYFVTDQADWVAMTPEGLFAASGEGAKALSIVKGLEVHSIDQVFEHLYRPDLVEARLKGDREGKYKDAAHKLNLATVLDSGPAPQIEHLADQGDRAGEGARLSVRVTGRGGGVGSRIVWRVNGITQGNPTPTALASLNSPLASVVVTETLKLVSGQANVVEVTAYNRAGLVATPPLKITIDKFGATTTARPRMFVLALGVDRYRMKDYRLNYATHDARSFARALETVGEGLFAEVKIQTLTDAEVNEASVAASFADIARQARPEDVFVLFLGGHGKSIAGRYYYYPQSLDFAQGHTVERHGIGQDKWEAWLAALAVQKSLLVIDTCEGDAFRGSRGTNAARQTAMAQLQHATGRNIIAASRDAAYEGYLGHGVLTYAILEALDSKASGGGDDRVRVAALADHVGVRVPEISQKNFGIYQNPTRKLTGNDFPIGIRQSVLTVTGGTGPAIPKEATHVVIREEILRERPAEDAPGSRTLAAGMQVRAVEFVGDWVIVARDGQKLGYVRTNVLVRLQ